MSDLSSRMKVKKRIFLDTPPGCAGPTPVTRHTAGLRWSDPGHDRGRRSGFAEITFKYALGYGG